MPLTGRFQRVNQRETTISSTVWLIPPNVSKAQHWFWKDGTITHGSTIMLKLETITFIFLLQLMRWNHIPTWDYTMAHAEQIEIVFVTKCQPHREDIPLRCWLSEL
jgi:hypothetical protein